jgi:hypothetical protein
MSAATCGIVVLERASPIEEAPRLAALMRATPAKLEGKADNLETNEDRAARVERQNKEREDELRRVPHQTIDKTKWPRMVRPISTSEADGLGIDADGRLHWNGKPVEIISRRIDLTWGQFVVAIVVAVFTALGALGAMAQGWAAYHDWACRNNRASILSCPTAEARSSSPSG